MTKPNQIPEQVQFRVSPRTMQMLGRENISSPVISVMELVKNAYDADATKVEVIFEGASSPLGTIMIADNGFGMDLDALINNWMVISTDNKVSFPVTPNGRRKVGEKGIGRLAMDRLAKRATIVTYQIDKDGLELMIDWSKYDQDEGYLQDISHPLKPVPNKYDGKSGTSLYLTDLRDRWSSTDYDNLYKNLALLVPPFSNDIRDFQIYFECSDYPELSGEVTNPVAEVAEYKLESKLTADNNIIHTLTYRSGEALHYERKWAEAIDEFDSAGPECGPLHFQLAFYLRDATWLKEADIKASELRTFLNNYQGVRIYRDNFRVKPYGEPGGDKDWLGLNYRFARSTRTFSGTGTASTWRVSERQVVGTVFITRDQNPLLMDQTNREGLVENQAYRDLQKFLLHGIQFLERERQKRVRSEITQLTLFPLISVEAELDAGQTRLMDISNKLNTIANSHEATIKSESLLELAHSIEEVAKEEIGRSKIAYETQMKEIEWRQTEYQLLVGLSTLGIAISAFGHEISRVIRNVKARASLLAQTLRSLPIKEQETVFNDLAVLLASADQVQSWGRFALDRVKQDKRTRRNLDMDKVVNDIFSEFSESLRRTDIDIQIEIAINIPLFRAFAMDIEAILINFITNAHEALLRKPLEQRRLIVSLSFNNTSSEFLLEFADSGNGINDKDIGEIFNPLFSTKKDKDGKPIGTGMGLTIVKSIVDSYQGRIQVNGHGQLGGAEFRVYLPHTHA